MAEDLRDLIPSGITVSGKRALQDLLLPLNQAFLANPENISSVVEGFPPNLRVHSLNEIRTHRENPGRAVLQYLISEILGAVSSDNQSNAYDIFRGIRNDEDLRQIFRIPDFPFSSGGGTHNLASYFPRIQRFTGFKNGLNDYLDDLIRKVREAPPDQIANLLASKGIPLDTDLKNQNRYIALIASRIHQLIPSEGPYPFSLLLRIIQDL